MSKWKILVVVLAVGEVAGLEEAGYSTVSNGLLVIRSKIALCETLLMTRSQKNIGSIRQHEWPCLRKRSLVSKRCFSFPTLK